MRTILLLYLFYFSFSTVFAQIPTDDIKRYSFTNGSLINEANPGSFDLSTGTNNRALTTDPVGTPNNALVLNGDTFNAGVRGSSGLAPVADVAISFWFKSNTNNSTEQIIMSQYALGAFGHYGWNIFLQDGKLKLTSVSLINGQTITPQLTIEGLSNVTDNNWHHVVCVLSREAVYSSGWSYGPKATLYIDTIFQGTNQSGGEYIQNATYLNPSGADILIGQSFSESLDNIRIYNKKLTALEIQALFREYTGPLTKLFVDQDATGNNNGSSWADAYTSLQDALNFSSNQDVWVKSGTYKPHASDRAASFVIPSDMTVYGGFVGTETDLNQRDWRANPTIISGDLLGNDDANVTFNNTTRNDNAYNLVKSNGNVVTIDGFTLTGAHANGTTSETKSGGAITKAPAAIKLFVKNCTISNNVSLEAGAGVLASFQTWGSSTDNALHIISSIFKNNLSTYGTSIYVYHYQNTVAYINVFVSNSLFDGNKATDNGTTKGYAGSAGWFRATGNNSNSNTTAILANNTYVNNIDSGTQPGMLNSGAIGFSKSPGSGMYGRVYNSIFWNNTNGSGVTSKAINNILDQFPTSVICENSLDVDNFSTAHATVNTITGNPLFVSPTNFELTTPSPAVGTGNNSKVPGDITQDLLGAARISGTTVDMGAYEYIDVCEFQVNTTTETTANVLWNTGISTDLLYVISGQPVANGTPVTGITTNSHVLTGLLPNTYYDVYSSATCSTILDSGWYLVKTFNTKGKIYVNKTATGANNGVSWADAYVDLQTAIASISEDNQDLWIAKGTYTPHASGRSVSFEINKEGVGLYGGFNGTETLISERNTALNPTIFSGDLLGNDDANISFSNTLRQDNAYNILKVNAENSVLDGIVFSSGHANGTATTAVGAAIYKNPIITSLTLKNCVFKNNVSSESAAGVHAIYTAGSTSSLIVEHCVFENNLATMGASFYAYPNGATTLSIAISNSLFNGNKTTDNGTVKGYAGSAGWVRGVKSNSTVNVNLTNNTYVNNIDSATYNSAYRGTIGLTREGISSIVLNANVNNCIFWNNTDGNNGTTKAVHSVVNLVPNVVSANNSLDSDNFSTITTKQNIITSDPLFVSTTDFSLTANSPAINAGDNSYVILLTDLAGNDRIFNTTVDMGAYEYSATLSIENLASFSDLTMYPNPTKSLLNINSNETIKSVEIYSIEGKQVLTSNQTQVDVSHLTSGMYLVKIISDTGKVGIKKLIKQ